VLAQHGLGSILEVAAEMIEALKLIGKLGSTFLKGKIAKGEAKAANAATWEEQAMKNSSTSWKDEYLTIIFTIPLICCFIPFLVPYVKEGFAVLETMPGWYQITLSVIVAASFGVRSVIGFMNKTKK
jgi:hypothetical protein